MDAQGYAALKKRIEAIKHKRIEVNKEIQLLKGQRETLVEELRAAGITDISNLPQLLADWTQNLQSQEADLNRRVKEIEQKLEV